MMFFKKKTVKIDLLKLAKKLNFYNIEPSICGGGNLVIDGNDEYLIIREEEPLSSGGTKKGTKDMISIEVTSDYNRAKCLCSCHKNLGLYSLPQIDYIVNVIRDRLAGRA